MRRFIEECVRESILLVLLMAYAFIALIRLIIDCFKESPLETTAVIIFFIIGMVVLNKIIKLTSNLINFIQNKLVNLLRNNKLK